MSPKLFCASSITNRVTVLLYVLNGCLIEPASPGIKSIRKARHDRDISQYHQGNFNACFQSCISSYCYNTTSTDTSTTTTPAATTTTTTSTTTATTTTTTTSPSTISTRTSTTTTTTLTTPSPETPTPATGSAFVALVTPRHTGHDANQEHLACYPLKNFTIATVHVSGGTPSYAVTSFGSNNGCYGHDGMDVVFEGETETEATWMYPCWTGTTAWHMEGQNDTIEMTVTDSAIPPNQASIQLKVQIDRVEYIDDDSTDKYRCDPDNGTYNFEGIGEVRILANLQETKVTSPGRPRKHPSGRHGYKP